MAFTLMYLAQGITSMAIAREDDHAQSLYSSFRGSGNYRGSSMIKIPELRHILPKLRIWKWRHLFTFNLEKISLTKEKQRAKEELTIPLSKMRLTKPLHRKSPSQS